MANTIAFLRYTLDVARFAFYSLCFAHYVTLLTIVSMSNTIHESKSEGKSAIHFS